MRKRVSVIVVTFDSEADLPRLLGSLRMQSQPVHELIVIDNASVDNSLQVVRRFWPGAKIIKNDTNLGFAAASNQGIRTSMGDAILLLNPDTEIEADFVAELTRALYSGDNVASACGKLLRFEKVLDKNVLDSAGMRMTRSLRHLDRGQGQIDRGQYDQAAYVFGGTGAALLLRRSALEKAAVCGEYFDERFHSYREDADLAWRLRLLGYECIYNPAAVARHRRRVTHRNRNITPKWINKQSVRNRFLMRSNNLRKDVYLHTVVQATIRDLLVLGACMTIERSSASAFLDLWRARSSMWERRKIIEEKMKTDVSLKKWFGKDYTEEIPNWDNHEA